MLAEWSFYWLVAQEWPGDPLTTWGDGRFFVLHGELGPSDLEDDVSMNLAFVDGHVKFTRLHNRPDHYFNEDYLYASEP